MFMRQIRGLSRSKVLAVSLIVQCASIHGEEISKESGPRPVSYWNDIRPLMQASCQGCHQPAKAKGDYILTDVKRLILGGESGDAAVTPGSPEQSYLLEQITPDSDGKAEMPPRDKALHETEIAIIRRWIAEGAVDDTPENAFQKYDMENPPVYADAPIVTSMDYSPDGSLLAIAGFHEVILQDAIEGAMVARLVGLSERIESVAFSPDGSMLAVTGGLPGRMGEVQVWDVAKRALKISVPVTYDTIYGAAWSPDNTLVSFGCSDNTLRAIRVTDGKQVLFMGGHNDWVLDSVFSRDGKQVISVGRDMTAKHTEVETERLIDNLTSITPGALKGGIAAVAGHPLKDEVLVGGSDGQPQVFRLKRQTARKIGDNANVVRKFPKMPGRIWDVSFDAKGKHAAAVSSLDGDGAVAIFNADYDSSIPDDIKKIFNKTPSGGEKQKLEAYWSREVSALHSISVPGVEIFCLAFSPDGKTLAVAGADGTVRFIEVESGKVIREVAAVKVGGGEIAASSGKSERRRLNRKRGKRAELSERVISADEISALVIDPAEIVLTKPNHYSQILVTARLKTGGRVDVTRQVVSEVSGDLLTVSNRGQVKPLRDGDGVLSVRIGGATVEVPVKVRNVQAAHVPDYVRDVKPVISRMGCDAGTCHGAKDGKNGFKLSLRGYDPLFDVRGFSDDISGRRVNYASPDDSLMLLKATGAVPHEGQQVTEPGSEYYQIIRDWIANGSNLEDPKPVVKSIVVAPKNPVIQQVGGQQQIRVVATYTDGSKRDVTRESFLESANQDVAIHDDYGLMTTLRRGEAPVLARYEGAYAATTLTVMGDRSGFEWAEPPAWGEIDKLVAEKWQRMKILPSDVCTDEEFLRRVYLDLTGLPPKPLQLKLFLADPTDSRTKREEVIDDLIGSPNFVQHWTNKWADMLMVNSKFLGGEGAKIYREWIRKEVEANTPYDIFVRKILTATGSNKENPPASYFKIHRSPDMLMENTTHLFLATRFNCNKCHDHPFERWTQDQYYEIAAFFSQVKLERDGKNAPKQNIGGTAVEGAKPLYEITKDAGEGEMKHERTGQITKPAFPYFTKHENPEVPAGGSLTRRQELAAWLTAGDNQFFARSYANRIWGYLLGTGVIEPLDDIRAGNPPSNPELLDYLAERFVREGFDVRKLIAEVCKSRTYQLSLGVNKWNEDDDINFSHAKARRLPAEVLYDAVYAVTGAAPKLQAKEIDAKQDTKSGLLATLGRPTRESACECDRANDVQLSGVMALLSGPDIADAIADPKNAIAKLVAEKQDDEKLITEIFLRVINRAPSEAEIAAVRKNWTEIKSDHEAMLAELAEREREWEPTRKAREAKRMEGIAKASEAIQQYQPQHDAERKRLEDEREAKIALSKKAVADYEGLLPEKAKEFATRMKGKIGTSWHLLRPGSVSTSDKSKVEILGDGSIRGTGGERPLDYRVSVGTKLTNITGMMVEVVPDLAFNGGPGLSKDGNMVITEIETKWQGAEEGAKEMPITFVDAKASFTQKEFDVKRTFDGNLDGGNRGWALAGGNYKIPHRAVYKMKDVIAGDPEKGVNLSVGILCRLKSHPLGRFRIYITTDPDPLQFGLPSHVVEAVEKDDANRSQSDRDSLRDWVAEGDADYQSKLWAAKGPFPAINPDKKMGELKKALEYAQIPIEEDPRLVRFRRDVEMSAGQAENPRLTAAQDLTWALINNPAFLFNH